jgi:hypothetical protein
MFPSAYDGGSHLLTLLAGKTPWSNLVDQGIDEKPCPSATHLMLGFDVTDTLEDVFAASLCGS